jgi:hypothetical protein
MFSIPNKNILKYILFTIVVLSLISYFPKDKLSFSEYIVIALPIIGLYIIFDSVICVSNDTTIIKTKKETFTQPVNSTSSNKDTISTTSQNTESNKSTDTSKMSESKLLAKKVNKLLKKRFIKSSRKKIVKKRKSSKKSKKLCECSEKSPNEMKSLNLINKLYSKTPKKVISMDEAKRIIAVELNNYVFKQNPSLSEASVLKNMILLANSRSFMKNLYREKVLDLYIISLSKEKFEGFDILESFSNMTELTNNLKSAIDIGLKKAIKDVQKEEETDRNLLSVKSQSESLPFNDLIKRESSILLETLRKINKKSKIHRPTDESIVKTLRRINTDPTFKLGSKDSKYLIRSLRELSKDPVGNMSKSSENRTLLDTLNKMDKKFKEERKLKNLAKEKLLAKKQIENEKKLMLINKINLLKEKQINKEKKKSTEKFSNKSEDDNKDNKKEEENEKLLERIRNLEKKLNKLESLSSSDTKVNTENSDWKYNTFNKKNMKPIGDGLQDWKNDYVLLNTDKWAPALNPAPVCKTEKKCPICPNMSAGYAKTYSTLKDFNSSRKIMPPDTINVDYINDKLNKGK